MKYCSFLIYMTLIFFDINGMELSEVLQQKLEKEAKEKEFLLLKIIKKQQEVSRNPLSQGLMLSPEYFQIFFREIEELDPKGGDPEEHLYDIILRQKIQDRSKKNAIETINAVVGNYSNEKQQLALVEERLKDNSLLFLKETVNYNNEKLNEQNLPSITEIKQPEQPKFILESVKKEIEKKIIVPEQTIEEKQITPYTQKSTRRQGREETEEQPSQVTQQRKTPSSPGWFSQAGTYVWEGMTNAWGGMINAWKGIKNFFSSIYNSVYNSLFGVS